MTDKIIDEVMGLIDAWCEKQKQAVDATYSANCLDSVYDDVRLMQSAISETKDAYEAIRAKLREALERKPLSDVDVQIEANNEDDFDWNDLGHKKTWHEGFIAGFRAAECTHKIGAE